MRHPAMDARETIDVFAPITTTDLRFDTARGHGYRFAG